jgi:hypothetical protein
MVLGSMSAWGSESNSNASFALGYNCYTYGAIGTHKAKKTSSGSDWRPSVYEQVYGQHYFKVAASGTADSAISWNTAMTITNGGNVGINHTNPSIPLHVSGVGNSYCARFDTAYAGQVPHPVEIVASNSAFSNNNGGWGMLRVVFAGAARTSVFPIGVQSAAGSDAEFYVRGDGNVFADGAFNGGGADYAEYFEWLDGNPNSVDRRGISVVLESEKIRPALQGESPIGVISVRPAVVGDNDIGRWKQKYLRSDFGDHVMEPYSNTTWVDIDEDGEKHPKGFETDKIPDDETVPSDAVVSSVDDEGTVLMRKKLNPDYDESTAYIPRADRQEWDTVGLMGKLRIIKGQPVDSRWIKMRDVSDTVEEWLVR